VVLWTSEGNRLCASFGAFFLICGSCFLFDQTQPNFIKRKHPRKGEKKK
jgi:hypothetical protein